MNTKPTITNDQVNSPTFGHAVVVGSSIAGLAAARVLTDHFAQVTIIERDQLPDRPQFRRGVPQARHAHILPLRGQAILEQQFPGLADELLAHGAISINGSSDMAFYIAGRWHQVRHRAAIVSLSCSRPLLESAIYRRVANHPRVSIVQECRAVGLQVDTHRQRVIGVRLSHRHGAYRTETNLAADLVVDASGRNSQGPQWMAGLGHTPPQESIVNAFSGYATRLYRHPTDFNTDWKTLYVKPMPPNGTRGGMIIPIEGGRWHVVLVGMAHDHPPIDEPGFMAYARGLPTPALFEALQEAEPLTKPYGYRRTENRARHYNKLPRYLEGFLVCGDAVYALDPVYAQGMTAAVMGSLVLDDSLRALRRQPETSDITGLARTFQIRLSQTLAATWQMVTDHDRRWPATEVVEGISSVRRRNVGSKLSRMPTRHNFVYT